MLGSRALWPLLTTQLCPCIIKAARDNTLREYVCLVSVKLYLQKQMVGQIQPAGSSLPTPSFNSSYIRH